MFTQRNSTLEQQRQAVVNRMWLRYYNNFLLEQGLISQQQFQKMQTEILSDKGLDVC